MEHAAVTNEHTRIAKALLAELRRQSDAGTPGPYVAPDDDDWLGSVVLDGKFDLHDLAAVVLREIRDDRIAIFTATRDELSKISAALEALPFKDAREPIRLVQEVENAILDTVGEYEGECEFCDEPVFIDNSPDADCEYLGDLGWAHRTCTDRKRKEEPEAFVADEDGGDE